MTEYAPDAIRWLARQLTLNLGGQLSGIVGDSAHTYGYHRGRNYVSWDDYSAVLLSDREGDGEAASALDWSLSQQGMRLFSSRLAAACDRNDRRLKYLREWYGTTSGTWVDGRIHNGEAATWVRATSDTSHLWHIHLGFFRKYANSQEAMQSVLSVISGRDELPIQDEMKEEEENMILKVAPGFAYEQSANGDVNLIDRSLIQIAGGPKNFYLTFLTDTLGPKAARVRVAVHDGVSWEIHVIDVPSSIGRIAWRGYGKTYDVKCKNIAGGTISIGRIKRNAADVDDDLPLSIMISEKE